MTWQLNSDMAFRQAGGYTGFTPKEDQGSEIITDFFSGVVSAGFSNGLEAYCATHGVDDIIIGQGTPPAIVAAINALGWPHYSYDDVTIVKVPPGSSFSYSYITGDFWPSAAPQNWMGHQVNIVTHGKPFALVVAGTGLSPKPSTMKMTTDSGEVTFQVGSTTVKTFRLPINAAVTLTADRTFVLDSIVHNGDERSVSVLISVEKEK